MSSSCLYVCVGVGGGGGGGREKLNFWKCRGLPG